MKSTKRFKAALAAVLVLALSPLFGGAAFAQGSSAVTYGGNKIAVTDPSTIWDWSGLIKSDTSSVGRIWTDKTVSDGEISKDGVTISKENGADFLTALTALSSTSNLSDTATTPLDIVLVLDASGSMDDPMGGGDNTKRIDALKSAANSFIDEIAKQNATVKDAAKQHQVAIVKFAGSKTDKVGNDTYRGDGGYRYNYSQVMKTLAPCTNDTKGAFSSQVNAIKPAGATNAAAGLELAKGQTSSRSDAKKIVIFFTDGKPTEYSEFEPEVASSAVGHAKDMKDAGAAVYSIGIFKGADPNVDPVPDSTSVENKFMHAVSSNYPTATYSYESTSWWSGEYKWNFGDRAKGSDGKDATFYKSATNADELKHVFDDISKEISKGSGYPTKTSEGFEHETGYIAFDDQLGDYMQVTDLSKLVYNGTVYGCKSKTTDGNVDTYHFSGDVHSGLADADLKDVVITVTRSNDVAVGDKVQVKVPASLIPLRNFAIDLAKDTMSVSNTTPISVLYSSGVKPAALDLLANPDDAMKAYMEKNTDETGKVSFYANKWTGKETGDVVATFEPAAGNSYYYFTQDTPIYTDEACTIPAKSVEKGSTYHYKHNYYAMDNGKPVAKTEHVSFPGDAAEKVEGSIAWDSTGSCYLKSGTPRFTYINELHKVKEENRTATATDVLNPKWSGIEQSSAETLINAYLGNNGKLSVDVPGTLTVTKQLQLPDGYNAADFANESFEFTIAMQDAVGKSFNAVVKNENGEQQGDKFVLAFGQNGEAKRSLKPGETLYVYGLSEGWDYNVSETPRDGFTAEAAGAKGQIAAGETSAVTYKNTYAASGTLDGETYLKGEKVLTGRVWLETDKFTFILKDADTSVEAPMPPTDTLGASKGEARVTVTSKDAKDGVPVSFHFESIGYTKPGTYTYQIWESEELSQLRAGVSASQALYQVVVTVTDEGHNGTLTVKSKMTKLADDDGVRYEKPQLVENDTASFVNEYDTSVVKWTPSGTKTYTDMTGENPLKSDMFYVIACTDNVKAPLPKGEGVTRVNHEWGGKMWYGALTTVEAGGSIAFPQATFTFNDIPSGATEATFEYKIVEVVKVDDTWRAVRDVLADKTFDPAGMVYDQTVWTAKVTIADVGGKLELSAKYYKNDSEEPITGAMFSFENSYEPKPAKLEGDTAIHGTKVLTGRDMAEGETFGFKLSAADDATQKAVNDGSIVIPKGAEEAVVSGAKAGAETPFSFGEMTFKKPGTYSFAVQEDKYCGNNLDEVGTATGGIVFDRHVHKVTVTVTDDRKGKLVAEVSYDNGLAKFENKYEQNAQFSGITVQKTLSGRDMAADEFSFSIHGVKSDTVSAEDAEARLADSDRSFTNAARADGVACDMAKMNGVAFTQADIGKTFAYEVREVVPPDVKPGVSYDKSVHTLEITVGMSGDADKHLTLTTKLDGKVVDSATKLVAVAFVNGYQATPTSYDTATAGLNKVLEGRDWIDSDSFTFELKALDGGPLPKDAAGNDVTSATVTKANAEGFGFGAIEFTSDMVKAEPDHKRTFTYEVREVVPADGHKLPGIQYDGNVATIKVTVSDDGSGTLKASAVAENTRFVNRYAAEIDYTAAGGLNVAKTLTGRDMAEGQFTIKVTPDNEASAYALGLSLEGAEIAMPAAADGVQAVKSALGEQHVVLRQSDVGKTYTYKVVEVVGEKVNGYTYDTTEYTVTVMAWDDPQKAALTVTTEVAGPEGIKTYVYGADPSAAGTGPAVVPFANAYAASTDNPGGTAAQVTATKALMGRPLSAGEFTFAVKYATGGDDLRTAKNAADGTVTFDALHYTTEMLEGLVKDGNASKTSDKGATSWTVSYLAYEKTEGLAGQGITAQTQPIPFTVTVVDNGDGSLTATANLDKGLKFENTYSTGDPVQVGLSGVKTLQTAPGLDPASIEGKFNFTVTSDDAAAPMPERTTAKNAADGSVDFGTIEFTLDDLNRALGVNDQPTAADADKAEADAAKAADQAAAPAKEADQAADAAEAVADADKAAADADSASAQAANDGGKPAAGDEQGAGAVAASDAASGTVDVVAPGNKPADQPANPEPESGKPRSHVFTYKVTESGSVPGVINDAAATKTVSFKVTDDGNGKLTVERQGAAANPAFSFTNTYTVEPANSSVTDQVTVTKTLTGRDMAAGEFAFELLEGEDVVATGANAADGSVTLNAVKYTQPGTHRYTLHEVGGGTVANGVTYDGATYTVVTTVKDNGDGTLSVTHALEGAREATFANAYQATSTTVTIGATKTLVGKNLENGQFTFVLTAADGTELKAKNAADGKIAFPALTFDKPGTYEFALTELDDAQANVTYDKRAYKVTVTVVDDGLGHLNATVAGDADVLAFTNTFAEPPAPAQPTQPGGKTFTPRGPIGKVLTQTGDDELALVLPLAAVALAGAASIVALCIMRRRDKR